MRSLDRRRGGNPRVERCDRPDSTSPAVAVVVDGDSGGGVAQPGSLDVAGGRIFWSDSPRGERKYRMWSSDPDGGNRRLLCSGDGRSPYALAVVEAGRGRRVYWTDGRNMALWRTDLSSCESELVRKFSLSRPMAVALLGDRQGCGQQPQHQQQLPPPEPVGTTEPCPEDFCLNGGNCTMAGSEPSCQCPEGLSGRRCDSLKVVIVGLPGDPEEAAGTADPLASLSTSVVAASASLVSLLVVLTACVCLLVARGRCSRRDAGGALPLPPPPAVAIISGKQRGGGRTFVGGQSNSVAVVHDFIGGNSGGGSNKPFVDLEDCCKMTICDKVTKPFLWGVSCKQKVDP